MPMQLQRSPHPLASMLQECFHGLQHPPVRWCLGLVKKICDKCKDYQVRPKWSHAMFDQVHNGNKWIQESLMDWLTCKMVMPAAVKESSSAFLAELGAAVVSGRTRTKVGCPNRALALAINFPMYPVAPITKILLFPMLANCSQWQYWKTWRNWNTTAIQSCKCNIKAIYIPTKNCVHQETD